ncbi:T9SS type A sorting domain-containing protein [Bacteroidota bacterium]
MKNVLGKNITRSLLFVIFLMGLNYASTYSQGHNNNNNHNGLWPDSMATITLNGKVIVDSTNIYLRYYLDVDTDDLADYFLSFGPSWYSPESGVSRPEHGEDISILGVLTGFDSFSKVVVIELNGIEWRELIEGGNRGWDGNHIWVDSLEVITVTGTAMLDTSYFYYHYYLDINDDENPDYTLNFGPPWFQPENGALRPDHGEIITIKGGINMNTFGTTLLMVYEIDSLEWRDPDRPSGWNGKWFFQGNADSSLIHCPSDGLAWINFNGGSFRGGMMYPDSAYCQFEEIHPNFMPEHNDSTLFAGYCVNIFYPDGRGMMNQTGHRGMMGFDRSINFQFHYDEIMLNTMGLSEHSIKIKAWNDELSQWFEVENYNLDQEDNLINFAEDDVYSYYGVFASVNITGIEDNNLYERSNNIKLLQNFPNPFSKETTIKFFLPVRGHVNLTIYDFAGRKIKTLINEELQSGIQTIKWDISYESQDIISGYFFARLQSGNIDQTLKLTYIK